MGVAEMPSSQEVKAIKKHMSETKPAVETKVEVAATPQETKVETPSQTQPEVDYEAELQKKDAEIAKVREEKDNYRKGMLKAKGKLPEEDDNSSEEDLDAKIDRKVQERLLQTREAQVQSEKDALVLSLAKKNKELTLALKNRGQINTSSGQGSNQERPEGKVDNVLSNDQLASLKARGWDDKKIEEFKKNLNKVNQMPK